MKKVFLTSLFLFAISVVHSNAQEVSGWTSLEWGASSQTLYGLAETELDSVASTYYGPKVDTFLYDSSGTLVASASHDEEVGSSSAYASVYVTGTPNQTYTLESDHLGLLGYITDCAGSCVDGNYDDYYNMYSFASSPDSSIDYEGDFDWFAPGPDRQQRSSTVNLAPTHSSAQTTTPVTCGDSRDAMISEYVTYNVGLRPSCANFTSTGSAGHFSFSELNTQNSYAYALLTNVLLSLIDEWWNNYAPTYGAMIVNSAYRAPVHNANIGGASNSRHMHGDAIDINNPTQDQTGRNNLVSATYDVAPSYIEPTTLACHLVCVHIDFRGYSESFVP